MKGMLESQLYRKKTEVETIRKFTYLDRVSPGGECEGNVGEPGGECEGNVGEPVYRKKSKVVKLKQ